MKIKAVCEITGLTSRTIRVYIEENLITPYFTENYLGRRTFDFSNDDVERLKSIAVLRKNDFSIDEIRDIINDSEKSIAIVQNVKNRIIKRAEEYRVRLEAFSYIDNNRAYTISELAEKLSQTQNELPAPHEDYKMSIVKTLKMIALFIVVWLPIVLCLFSSFMDIKAYTYPKFNIKFIVLTFLTLIPSILAFVISKIEIKPKKIIKKIIIGFCIISIPFSFIVPFGIVSRSETTDFRNYRDFDPECLANRSEIFQELFPAWPHYFENVKQEDGHYETVYLDAKYYYQYFQGIDYTYDIYAEWPLKEDDFNSEVNRVKQMFEKIVEENHYYDYVEIEKGDFTCLVLYNGNEPFHEVTNSYEYSIFAYDKENKIVRYIFCDSLENGVDQPYYLQLEW